MSAISRNASRFRKLAGGGKAGRSGAHACRRRLAFEPLEVRLVLDSTVVFNEIMYNPTGAAAGTPEWIELHNQMAVDMDISAWSIQGGVEFKFPAGTVIPGGGYLVVAADLQAMTAATGFQGALGPLSGNLASEGEPIELVNNNQRIMDVLDYRDGGQWPVAADGGGATLAKSDPDAASERAANWRNSGQVGGTPGAVNFPQGPLLGPETTHLAIDAGWWYDDSGTNRGTTWRDVSYSPSAEGWKQGGGLLYDETSALPGPKTTPLASGRNTYYFRTEFAFAGNPAAAQLTLNCVIDDGAVFYLNGVEVHRLNMPVGTLSYATNALTAVENAVYGSPIILSGSGLVAGTNVLAVEVHQAATSTAPGLTLVETGGDNGSGGVPDNLARASRGSVAFAKDVVPGYPDRHTIPGLNDGVYGNSNSWIGNSSPTFAGVRFSAARSISKIAWGRDNTGTYSDRTPGTYTVQYTTVVNPNASTPDASWTTIGSVTYGGAFPDSTPARRHVWSFSPVAGATGVRVLCSDGGTCIDELEVYELDAPDAVFGAVVTSAPILDPSPTLQLNEVAPAGGPFWLELRNHGTTAVSTTGLVVTTQSGGRYALPTQSIAAGGLLLLDEAALGFRPVNNEKLFLYGSDGATVLDAARMDAQLRGRSLEYGGRWLYPSAATPEGPNTFAFQTGLVINEIMYRSYNGQTGVDADDEWIELYNRGDVAIDLTGWSLKDAVDYAFPAGTQIPAGGYLVVARNAAALAARFPGITVLGDFTGQLADSDERIQLIDQYNNPADEVHYYDGGRWPEFADGGGGSLELRDPRADNGSPEAWAASNEVARSTWQTYTYQGTAAADGWSTQWNEFVLGLLDDGEVLLDDISVIENPATTRKQLVQNTSFQSDTVGSAPAKWRIQGNHSGTVVVDPDNAANKVLRLVASGPMEDRMNHAETTFLNNVAIVNGRQYEISFKARWLHGSNLLTTRLYSNRLPKTHVLAVPALHGTPGTANSVPVANIGPTYSGLIHSPVLPSPGQAITVNVTAADPDNVAQMRLWYSVNGGAAQSVVMSHQGGGRYQATIPGQAASAVVQFYVQGTDGLGAASYFPAAGPKSRALIAVQDNQASDGLAHNFRIIMTPADVQTLETSVNLMSNGLMSGTVVYKENQVFYDVGVRLSGSNAGRGSSAYRNFAVRFDPMQPFRGIHTSVILDRSGRGARVPLGQDEIVIKHILNQAGGVPGEYDDIVYVIAPNPAETRSALLLLDPYGNDYLDAQFDNGADGLLYELRVQYIANGTLDGNPESLKVPNPYNHSYTNSPGRDLADYGNDKETYRFHLQLQNNQARDDFSRIIELSKAMSLSGAALKEATDRLMDIDETMRVLAVLALSGTTDVYSRSWYHNAYFYVRPEDGRVLLLPQDWDNPLFGDSASASLVPPVSNMNKLTNLPGNLRLFQGHLLDVVNTTFNAAYLTPWLAHYGAVAGQNFGPILDYVNARRAHVLQNLLPQVPFAITTNNGNNFSVSQATTTLTGTGWINVREIRLAGVSQPLPVKWINDSQWQVVMPLAQGANAFSFQAIDFQGNLVGGDSITVTSTVVPPPLQQHLRIAELNYNPTSPTAAELALGFTDGDQFEFIELWNTSATATLDLAGVKFTAGVGFDFTAAAITSLAPGQRVLVVRDPAAFQARYGVGLPLAGSYTGGLDNGGERLLLVDGNGQTLADFNYSDSGLWPGRADGMGSTLELLDANGGYESAGNWRASIEFGGTPGSAGVGPTVVVNEVLSHTDQPLVDTIELHNTSADPIDIGGWWLSDSSADYFKFQIPAGTIIAGRGYLSFHEGHYTGDVLEFADGEFGYGPKGFGLNGAHGDDVWLVQADASGNVARFADHVELGAAANGESYGRWLDDQGRWRFGPLLRRTFDAPNQDNASDGNGPRVGPLIVSEVMYAPKPLVTSEQTAGFATPEDMEFLAVFNPTTVTVDLTHWRVDKAVSFAFPDGASLGAGQALVIVPFDPANTAMLAAFRSRYGMAATLPVLGPYSGRLRNSADWIQLLRPDAPPVDEPAWYPPLVEDEVVYDSSWGANGDGKSLRRVAADAWGMNAASWGLGTFSGTPSSFKPHLLAGRYVFYNDSAFDGRSSAANAQDDAAIAADKQPLLPGRRATFDNYTSYARGINGVMLDVANPGTIVAADFEFRAGNDGDPETWALVTAAATISARPGAGVGGTTRVTITWPDNTIQNQWLRVEVLATSRTGLAAPDVVYFGNAIGETGNHRDAPDANAVVDQSDEAATQANRTAAVPVGVDNRYDFNRDRRVNATDELLARSNYRQGGDSLRLLDLTIPEQSPGAGTLAASESTDSSILSAQHSVLSTQYLGTNAPSSVLDTSLPAAGVARMISEAPVESVPHSASHSNAPTPEAIPIARRNVEPSMPRSATTVRAAAHDAVLSSAGRTDQIGPDAWAWLWSMRQDLPRKPLARPAVLPQPLYFS